MAGPPAILPQPWRPIGRRDWAAVAPHPCSCRQGGPRLRQLAHACLLASSSSRPASPPHPRSSPPTGLAGAAIPDRSAGETRRPDPLCSARLLLPRAVPHTRFPAALLTSGSSLVPYLLLPRAPVPERLHPRHLLLAMAAQVSLRPVLSSAAKDPASPSVCLAFDARSSALAHQLLPRVAAIFASLPVAPCHCQDHPDGRSPPPIAHQVGHALLSSCRGLNVQDRDHPNHIVSSDLQEPHEARTFVKYVTIAKTPNNYDMRTSTSRYERVRLHGFAKSIAV